MAEQTNRQSSADTKQMTNQTIRQEQPSSSEKEYTVGGYTFSSKAAAQTAKDELNAIKYMSAKTNSKDPRQVYALYNSIIDKHLFNTLVGLNYLKELQQFLYLSKEIPNTHIKPIPINQDVQSVLDGKREAIENQSELRKITKERNMYKDRLAKSLIVNAALIIVIIAMLFITLTSKNANILNYERNLQDKYATWQEELESREAAVKAKENNTK